jgi:hypothetical protein
VVAVRSNHLILLSTTVVMLFTIVCAVATSIYDIDLALSSWTLTLITAVIVFQPKYIQPPYTKNVNRLMLISSSVFFIVVIKHAFEIMEMGLT